MTISIRSARVAIGALFSVCAAALLAQPAAAQIDSGAVEPGHAGQPASTYTLGYQHQFQTDIDAGGHFSRDTALARGVHRATINDDWSITTQFNFQASIYDIGGWGDGPLNVYSWTEIYQATLAGIVGWRAAEHWEVLFALLGGTSGEASADFTKTLGGGAGAGFLYQSSPDFQIGALVGAVTQLGGGGQILPLPMVDWKMSDQWKFHLGITVLDQVGYGGELTYTPIEQLSLGMGGSFEKRRFRLVDNGDIKRRIGEESSFPVYARIGWLPTENLTLSLTTGVALGGQVRIANSSGNKLPNGQKDYDPAPGLGFQAQLRF